MKREHKRCEACSTVYLILEYGQGRVSATYYDGGKLLHSDGNGNASKHAIHRKPHTIDVLDEMATGGLPIVTTECRCQVRHVSLQDALGELYRR